MKPSRSRFLIIFVLCSLTFQGCIRCKLVGQPQEEKVKTSSHKYAYTLKSRNVYTGTSRRGYDPQELVLKSVVEKALHDSFSYHGISDVIKSEKIETDRINIVAYSEGGPGLAGDNVLLEVLYVPWSLVTLATLGLIPLYGVADNSVEIHIIDSALAHDQRLKILHAHYSVSEWWWFPFAFMSNDDTPEGVYYRTAGTDPFGQAIKKTDYLGWRQIFDRVIADVEKKQ